MLNVCRYLNFIYFVADPNIEDGLDASFVAVGLYYWPIGVGYTVAKGMCRGVTNYAEMMLDLGLVPGRDDLIIWK